jgi:RHS repeat-associated protein
MDYFGARYYRASSGRFATVDPLMTIKENLVDPQKWNRYAYVRNNPLRWVDPDGRELRLTGDVATAFGQLCEIAGASCSDRLTYDKSTGVVSFNVTGLDLGGNEGAALLSELISSTTVYGYHVGASVPTAGGDAAVGTATNLDALPDDRMNNRRPPGKRAIELPVAGVDSQVAVNTAARRASTDGRQLAPFWTLGFHELAEAQSRVEQHLQYQPAHAAAIRRELILRAQRPQLLIYGLGAGPWVVYR